MKEYKIAKGWAIFTYIAAPLLILLFITVLFVPFIPGSNTNPAILWFFAPLSVIMITMMVIGLLDTAKAKFVIDKDRVYARSTLSNRELLFTDIKGYRLNDKFILIEPLRKEKKKIKVSNYFGNKEEIIGWLSTYYPDLDVVNAGQEQQEILNNEAFGFTPQEREEQLAVARKWAKFSNIAGFAIGIWTFVYPKPYEYAVAASLLMPLAALLVLKKFNGLIRINEQKGSAYPSVISGIIVSGMALCVRALTDYDIFNYAHVWMPAVLVTLVLTGLLIWNNKEFTFKEGKDFILVITFILFAFGYSYGAVVTTNCFFDNSQPQQFGATIISKRISSGKHTTYYLKLTRWGQQKEADEVSVSKDLYNKLDENDDVTIYFRQGRYNIPWFVVTE